MAINLVKSDAGLTKNAQRILDVKKSLDGSVLEKARVSRNGYLTFEGTERDFPRLVSKLLKKGVGLSFKPEKKAFKLFKY